MPTEDEIAIVRAYSEGRVTRAEVSDVFGEYVSFGRLLLMLRALELPLPTHRGDPNSPGRLLLRELLRQQDEARDA